MKIAGFHDVTACSLIAADVSKEPPPLHWNKGSTFVWNVYSNLLDYTTPHPRTVICRNIIILLIQNSLGMYKQIAVHILYQVHSRLLTLGKFILPLCKFLIFFHTVWFKYISLILYFRCSISLFLSCLIVPRLTLYITTRNFEHSLSNHGFSCFISTLSSTLFKSANLFEVLTCHLFNCTSLIC